MGFLSGYTTGLNAKAKREELNLLKTNQELRLKQLGYENNGKGGFNTVTGGAADLAQQQRELQQQQINEQKLAFKAMEGRLAARDTYSAIEEFVTTSDASALQRRLDNNPALKKLWNDKGVMHISNIDFENDTQLLESAGITKDYINNPEAKAALKKATWKYYNGREWKIGLLNQLVAETNVLNNSSKKRQEIIFDSISGLNSALAGINPEIEKQKINNKTFENETDRQQTNINKFNAETDNKKTLSNIKTDAEKLEIDRKRLDLQNKKLDQFEKDGTRGKTKNQKNIAEAEAQTNKLLNMFGGEEEFKKVDWSDLKNYNKAIGPVQAIEEVYDIKYSETEKKDINNIRQIIALADPAKELTKADTGLIDNMIGNAKKYITDNLKGVKARAAMLTMRNMIRHSLYSTALTKYEGDSYDEANGTLGQQLGPVLAQFQIGLHRVRAKLDSIIRNGNPYVNAVRLGIDKDRLGDLIKGIDARLEYIDNVNANIDKSKSQLYKPQTQNRNKKSLDSIKKETVGAK